jgi:hypothetical protein
VRSTLSHLHRHCASEPLFALRAQADKMSALRFFPSSKFIGVDAPRLPHYNPVEPKSFRK